MAGGVGLSPYGSRTSHGVVGAVGRAVDEGSRVTGSSVRGSSVTAGQVIATS
jgi:hypothetical protein